VGLPDAARAKAGIKPIRWAAGGFPLQWIFLSSSKQEPAEDGKDRSPQDVDHGNRAGRFQGEDEEINQDGGDLDRHLRHGHDIAGLRHFERQLILPGDHGGRGHQDQGGDHEEDGLRRGAVAAQDDHDQCEQWIDPEIREARQKTVRQGDEHPLPPAHASSHAPGQGTDNEQTHCKDGYSCQCSPVCQRGADLDLVDRQLA